MIRIYKPNKNNTGSALSFSYDCRTQSVYGQIIKQATWDNERGKASFAENVKVPDKNVVFKFDMDEAADIINTFETLGLSKFIHSHNNRTAYFNFGKTDESKGYTGFTLNVNVKEGENSNSFFIPLSESEARIIVEYFKLFLRESFLFLNKEWAEKRYNKQNNTSSQGETSPQESNNQQNEQDW